MHKTPCESVKWCARQIKGSPQDEISDADNFTCVEFNESGNLLAVGDKGGRITVYHVNKETGLHEVYCAFTSHEPEFDYLKSLEIEEKINFITWLPNSTSAHHLLTANDKTIKLWRLSERHYEAYNFNIRNDENSDLWPQNLDRSNIVGPPIPRINSSDDLRVPRFRKANHLTIEARLRRVFANAHTYHINAVSMNSDLETFLSADDLRVNLWHLDVSNQSFTIVDLKPSNMEDLAEVITCARFHPVQCHLLAYSTSRGVIRLCDMRHRALCDNHVMVFEDPSLSQNLGFFADIIASLSDFRFGYSGNYLLARDYLTLKVWDMRMGDRPCEIYSVHEPFRSELCMLYENDAIFDKFLCAWSADDRYALTGSYGNLFRIFDRHTGYDWLYDLNDCKSTDYNSPQSYAFNLIPKRFISPDDPLGNRLGLTSISVAPLDAVESLFSELVTSHTSSHSSCSDATIEWDRSVRSHDVFTVDLTSNLTGRPFNYTDSVEINTPTGSKRRKQVLPSRSSDDSDNSIGQFSRSFTVSTDKGKHSCHNRKSRSQNDLANDVVSLNEEDSLTEHNSDEFHSPLRSSNNHQHHHHKRKKKKSNSTKQVTGHRNLLSGLRELDCQHKLLHLSWHPNKLITVTVSGNQLYVVSGEPTRNIDSVNKNQPTTSGLSCRIPDPVLLNDDNDSAPVLSPEASTRPITDPLESNDQVSVNHSQSVDIKVAKRRRRRHHISDTTQTDPALWNTTLEAINNNHHTLFDDKSNDGPLNQIRMDYTNYEADGEDSEADRLVLPHFTNHEQIPCIDTLFSLPTDKISSTSDNGLS